MYFWIKLYFFTWLIASSCGQSRHDSCQPFPGVPQAGENGKRESQLYWRIRSIFEQALCHWTLQENQVLALINTRFHTIRIGLSHGIIVHLITLLMRKNTALWHLLLQWIYLQSRMKYATQVCNGNTEMIKYTNLTNTLGNLQDRHVPEITINAMFLRPGSVCWGLGWESEGSRFKTQCR